MAGTDIFSFTIEQNEGILSISPSELTVGSRYDHMAQQLSFVRPLGFENSRLTLYFYGMGNSFEIDIGTQNSYTLPNMLTQWTVLKMQVAFTSTDGQIEHTQLVTLGFRDSLVSGAPEPEPLPTPTENLLENAWYGEYSQGEGYISVKNSRGEEVVRLPQGTAVIKALNEADALALSAQDPANIYWWGE